MNDPHPSPPTPNLNSPPTSHVVSPSYSDANLPTASRVRFNIEDVTVEDDPRLWPHARKMFTLGMVASAAMVATLGANIYNPGIADIEHDLHASDSGIALSLSIFILVQGVTPVCWSALGEINGRKLVYISSMALYFVGCVAAATAKSMGVLIGMRVLQGSGGSAVLTSGAATLADIFAPSERGTMMGIYYAAPLLGPSIGPILGGALTQGFNWRASFWFLAIFGGCILVAFLFFKDTFRRERSLAYQAAARRYAAHLAEKRARHSPSPTSTVVEKREASSAEKGETTVVPPSPAHVKASLRDINPIPPVIKVVRQLHNLVILLPSGLLFGYTYCVSFTCARTFAAAPYSYDALQVGLVLLSLGLGSIGGSILGGKYSDRVLARLKEQSADGRSQAEQRLKSTIPAMLFFPPCVIAYGWMAHAHVHVAAVSVMLFLAGFFSIWIYSSTLAYIVDANPGRSSSAVAVNSLFRGVFGFIFSEVAPPLQNAIGDGGLYSLWGGITIVLEFLILLVMWRGARWREARVAKEQQNQQKS